MLEALQSWGLWGMFFSAFLAATILPLSSEIVLSGLILSDYAPVVTLLVIATTGNVAGSCLNYLMGYWGRRPLLKRILRTGHNELVMAENRFRRYGIFSLLFAWVPVIGDPITIVAGLLRVNPVWFLVLVTIGKAGRYCFVAYAVL